MAEKQLVRLDEVEGFQHAQDNFWMRPLLFGKGLYVYVGYMPPGEDMPAPAKKKEDLPAPAKKKEAGPERSLYMLEGSLEITYGEEKFEITPEMALLVPPGTPFGIKNAGRETASFILTYSPPPYPEIKSREDLRKLYEERMRELYGRSHVVKSPEEMKELRGRKSA